MKRLTQIGIALTTAVLVALGLTGCCNKAGKEAPASEHPQAEAVKETAKPVAEHPAKEHPAAATEKPADAPKDHPAH